VKRLRRVERILLSQSGRDCRGAQSGHGRFGDIRRAFYLDGVSGCRRSRVEPLRALSRPLVDLKPQTVRDLRPCCICCGAPEADLGRSRSSTMCWCAAMGASLSNGWQRGPGCMRGDRDAIVASAIFDERFYLLTYPDIAAAGVDPSSTILVFGRFENRKPVRDSSTLLHMLRSTLRSRLGMEPFLHYVLIGQVAARPCRGRKRSRRGCLTRENRFGATRLMRVPDTGSDAPLGGVISFRHI